MFQMWNISGVQSNYAPGTIRKLRENRAIGGTERVGPVETITEGAAYRVTQAYDRRTQTSERRRALTAKDIMRSPVFCVPSSMTISNLSEILTIKRYRHVPVVNDQQRLVGLVSDRDLLRFNVEAAKNNLDPGTFTVVKIMASTVLTAFPEAEIHQVVRVMFDERIGGMPIVDKDGEVVGIVTRSDILRALLDRGPIELWV